MKKILKECCIQMREHPVGFCLITATRGGGKEVPLVAFSNSYESEADLLTTKLLYKLLQEMSENPHTGDTFIKAVFYESKKGAVAFFQNREFIAPEGAPEPCGDFHNSFKDIKGKSKRLNLLYKYLDGTDGNPKYWGDVLYMGKENFRKIPGIGPILTAELEQVLWAQGLYWKIDASGWKRPKE